ncbi:leucine-rich repeat serine/threonine-protein kinase 1 isoform X4 [Bactrocera tryoni]|uniref:leucine-rich repeat serine/threonine-protein kinase 1 isoform X4 n=1 Tax=Bactrocera tryoni TaxID=59916 RepID=UPI001A9789CF|nr:leucine-rich repeat serine/threonine-protein kinase 1 isoform X4 [Bactrocera tryoni]
MSWHFVDKPKPGTETALEACDYFVDEVIEFSHSLDAREQVRMIKHRELRNAVINGDERTVCVLLEALGSEREVVTNMAPAGANTLLYLASQAGYEGITNRLLDAGADGRSHTVTKYSPLYVAVHHGYYNIAKLMLERFPELIKQPTVERWLPIHAACINGHIPLLELLIGFKYPQHLYSTYRDVEGQWEWRLPFDPNAQDVTGQTSLYIASILGNKSLVNLLLKWRVKCQKTVAIEVDGNGKDATRNSSSSSTPITPTRKRISFGIQAIMLKLNITGEDDNRVDEEKESEICPINLNLLCGAARETALLAAVRGGFIDVAKLLLEHGANPNIIAKPVEDQNDPKCIEEIYGLSNIPITEACKQHSLPMLELLLKYGARDANGTALSVAISSEDEVILNSLLAQRVHPDSDYKIHKKGLPEPIDVNAFLPSAANISYSAMFPNVPTIIDWHNNTNVHLSFVRINWLVNGVLKLNPKLQGHPMVNEITLTAITRIDFSHNSLSNIPMEIFKLVSLKYLNIAQNKISSLPSTEQSPNTAKYSYNCPVLEELFMQDNRLVTIPTEIFHLPSLTILDISNNKLQEMPFDMWKAPKLRELNIAFNLLRDLPVPPMQQALKSHLSLEKLQTDSFLNADPTNAYNSNKQRQLDFHQLIHRNIWANSLEITDNEMKWNKSKQEEGFSKLNSLNIANNLFTSIPVALPCLAANLTRLNMSYNSLRSMGHVTSYPSTLKQLDLSHNEISCWPSLPRITNDSDPHLLCYSFIDQHIAGSADDSNAYVKPVLSGKTTTFRSTVLKSVCQHRRHLKLESLRTLILADNLLTRIQLSTDDVTTLFNESDDADWSVVGVTKSKLIFPNLSMLDISNNCLKEIPTSLHELNSLSVLNISGNVNITDLPPHLGLLSRLWNLNTRGCLLQEPLKSMIESKKYKTMDIIGYLKSIYENSVIYARMKLMVVGVQGIGKTTLLDLLRQGGGTQKTRASENHWTKRMGHRRNTSKLNNKGNISTVGVDIGTWICEKRKKAPGSHGPVIFRTWDFGGQKEYYATHQYFLSKRSLYLVLWKITDGHKGLSEILQWLGNIQARAPNSAVIIVGTHFDAVGETFSAQQAEELQQIIREKFIAIPDAEKIGLPRVIDSIEISCRTMHNVRLLANIIYDTAFMLRSPGSKEALLLQKVPATYIALEDIVNVIAGNLRSAGVDPVLDAEEYRKLVTEEMRLHNYKSFRDSAELNQATMFLHDNGVILHYDDATLRDYYFLDPQWLCDMLAHVVTVREINPFARTGIMNMDDLGLLFRSDKSQSKENRSYIVSLLNKFEVALTWDSRTLLIPSLLPHHEECTANEGTTVKVFQRSRTRNLNKACSNKINVNSLTFKLHSLNNLFGCDVGLRRILLMTYFPSGFWSRILTRLLADEQITEAIKSMYLPENDDSLYHSDADSGVGPDSTCSSRNTSIDGHPIYNLQEGTSVCYCWMVEECILSVYNETKIVCPVHLDMQINWLAPDVVFADIPERYSINSDDIIKGTLLGRGAFGFVFKATCKLKAARNFKAVAMKMLQPVPPGPRAKESALMAYKIALGKWDRDPLQHSCKAYCTARQELAVLLTLKHQNIVPLVGICIRPLALVLELAPMGGLDLILRQYRRRGAHVGPHTFQILVLQAARAIEYLHRRRIIYRDLKSENVLVWDFPDPHSEDTPRNTVHIKIADYGISRQTAPNGSKGFGGTEGFMAPEIIRYNGEEEYTEKVDCFSFGMFIYEIISLRQPFEGYESIKECILEGSRPPLTQRETQFPSYCLDLMVLCWDELPKKRPSASQIVSILSAPECIHLLDTISLPHNEKVVCGIFNDFATNEDGTTGFEIWLPSYNSRIDIVDVLPSGNFLQGSTIFCVDHIQMDNSPRSDLSNSSKSSRSRSNSRQHKINMISCCIIEDCVWIGDTIGNIHSYSIKSYAHTFTYMLDPVIKSPVISLVYLRNIERVAIGLHNGRVFLVDSTKIPTNCAFAEGTFVLTEICSGLILHSACSVIIDNEYELWCGEMAGKINVFPLNKSGVCGHQSLCHSDEPNIIEDVKVARMFATDDFVFSCLYPGFIVYQWNVYNKRIENKLDCSKLLPCSESLKSIAIDEHLSLVKCQISALASHSNELYIGTTWGCLIITELNTLRPITVFRPYENEIKSIITVPHPNFPLIATIGRRYRSLIARFMDIDNSQEGIKATIYEQGGEVRSSYRDIDNHIHVMLWRTNNWA